MRPDAPRNKDAHLRGNPVGVCMRPAVCQNSSVLEPQNGTKTARLDNLGCVKSHCCFVNNPERLDRLKKRLQAAASLGDIEQAQKIAKRRKRDEEECTLRPLFRQAVSMFRNGEHGSKFTKKHIKSIMLIAFGTSPKKVMERRLNGSTN